MTLSLPSPTLYLRPASLYPIPAPSPSLSLFSPSLYPLPPALLSLTQLNLSSLPHSTHTSLTQFNLSSLPTPSLPHSTYSLPLSSPSFYPLPLSSLTQFNSVSFFTLFLPSLYPHPPSLCPLPHSTHALPSSPSRSSTSPLQSVQQPVLLLKACNVLTLISTCLWPPVTPAPLCKDWLM